MAANFGTALLVAQAGAAQAGVFFAATAVVTILGNTTGLGTMTGLVYHLPAIVDPESGDGAGPGTRSLLMVALGPVVALSVLTAALLAAVAGPVAGLIAADRVDDIATMLVLLAPTVPGWALTIGLLGATRGLGSVTPTVAINQVFKPLAQLAAIAAVVLVIGPSPAALALAWGVPVLATAVAALGAVVVMGGFRGRGPGPVDARTFWRYTRPRAVATGFQIALERVDVILVSALAGPAAAGVYGTITRYVTAGNFLVFSIGQATAPAMRRAVAAARMAEAGRVLTTTTSWMVAVTWPYALLLAIRSPDLVALLNPDFTDGRWALVVLGVALLINAASGPVDLALLMLGRSTSSLVAVAAALATDVVLALVLIPPLGMLGAAIAWAAAIAVQNGGASYLVDRAAGLRAPSLAAAIAGLGAVVAVVPIGVAAPEGFTGLVFATVVAGVLHATWLAAWSTRLDLPVPDVIARRLPRR